jgi:hypothetical protein
MVTTIGRDMTATDAAALAQWCAERPLEALPSSELASLVASSLLELPLPGGGATWTRLQALAQLGSHELSLARLAEGHTDAVAILAEARYERDGPVPGDARLGVWAAGPLATLTAERVGGGWRLRGARRWCSGAPSLTHALVTAAAGATSLLFLVDLNAAGVSVIPDTWQAVGMAGSETFDVSFDNVRLDTEAAVGPGDFYLTRPGFWQGAIGVAAVWWGGARAAAAPLLRPKADASLHRLAHAGAVRARLWSMEGALRIAAERIDEDPLDSASAGRALAAAVRHIIESGATEILDRVGRATGAEPLGHDRAHARRVADLTVYLRQSHAEADMAALEEHVLSGGTLRGFA